MWIYAKQVLIFLDVNKAALKQYGYSRREFLALHPSDVSADKKVPRNSGLAKYCRKDGSIINVEVKSHRLTYEGHKAAWVIARQLVEHEHFQETDRGTLSFVSSIISSSPIGIIAFKATGEAVSANEAALKMIGGRLEQMLAQNFRSIKSWKETGLLQAAETALASQREQRLEVRGISTFSKHFWFSVRLIPFEYDGAPHLLGLFSDVTEQGKAEEAVRESENRYHKIFEESPICIWVEDFSEVKKYFKKLRSAGITDLKRYLDRRPEKVEYCASLVKVLDVNQASLSVFEAETKDELLNNLAKVISLEALSSFKDEMMAVWEGRQTFEGETVDQTLKGRKMNLLIKWSEIPNSTEDSGKVLVTILDITERRLPQDGRIGLSVGKRDVDLRVSTLPANRSAPSCASWNSKVEV